MAEDTNYFPDVVLDVLMRGFDVTDWGRHTDTVLFAKTYNNAHKVRLQPDNKLYYFPDDTRIEEDRDADGTEALIFRNQHEIDENTFKESVEASIGYGGFTASVEQGLTEYSKVDKNTTTNTSLNAYYKKIVRVSRTSTARLDDDFSKALLALNKPDADFRGFFQDYGTHYLKEGFVGGSLVLRMVADESVLDTDNARDTKEKIKAGFKGGVNADAKADIENSVKRQLNIANKEVHTEWHAVGGDGDGTSLKDFLKSVETLRELLCDATSIATKAVRPTFRPIYELVADASLKAALKAALGKYIAQSDFALGVAKEVDPNTNYRAPSDGFVYGRLWGVDGINRGWAYLVSDTMNTPSTQRAATAVHPPDSSVREADRVYLRSMSFFSPVRKGDHYNIQTQAAAGTVSSKQFFQPFELGFGDWVKLENEVPRQAAEDGLVVAVLNSGDRNNYGKVFGLVSRTSDPQSWRDYDPYGTAAIVFGQDAQVFGWIQSICIPVPKGKWYNVHHEIFFGSSTVEAYWLPLRGRFAFGSIEQINEGRYTALTDGLIFGIATASDGARGWASIRVAEDTSKLQSGESLVATTGVQNSPPALFPENSLIAPVRRGQAYQATTGLEVGDVKGRYWFMQIVKSA